MEHAQLRRTIGLAGAVATLLGYIIGGSIFILPGKLAATAGPGVFVSYLLASLPALFLCVVGAQIGNVFPVSGANCIAISTVLSPFWGFMFVWMIMVTMLFAIAPLALGFAEYLTFFLPALADYQVTIAILTVIAFIAVNLFGVRTAVWVQVTMVVVFMIALLVFGIGGVASSSRENLLPMMPNGFSPVLEAAIPAYYSYSGFLMIVSLGGEIKNPRRTIPIALAVGFVLIAATYTLVSLAVPGVLPWREIERIGAPVSAASETFLPAQWAGAMTMAALLAMATSINGLLLAKSRDLFALAEDEVFPSLFGHVSRRHLVPDVAVVTIGTLAVIGLLFRGSFKQYASFSVLCVMFLQILAGFVVLMLARRLPQHFERATFRLSPTARIFWSLGLIALSAAFVVRHIFDQPESLIIIAGVIGVGVAAFLARRDLLMARGIHIDELLRKDISHLLEDGGEMEPAAAPATQGQAVP